MKSSPKKTEYRPFAAAEKLTAAAVCALALVLPLLLHDSYHDATRTKALCYWVLTGLYALGLVLCLLPRWRELAPLRERLCRRDWLLAASLGCLMLSTALFRQEAGGFWGADARYQSTASALCTLVWLLGLRCFGKFGRMERFCLLLGLALTALVGLAEYFGWDVLGLVALTAEDDRSRFLSTVGNIGFFSAYCVLLTPVAADGLLRAREKKTAVLCGLLTLLGFWAALAARTESAVLGFLTFLAFLPLLEEERYTRRVWLLLSLLALSGAVFSLLAGAAGRFPLSALAGRLCGLPALLAAGVCLGLFFLLKRASAARFRRVYGFVLTGLLAAGCVLLLLANTVLRERLPENLAAYLVIDADWGTDRGLIWQRFGEMYRDFPLVKKLLGGGAGVLAAYDRVSPIFPDAITDAAHNEYLNILWTSGLLGLGCYLAFLGGELRAAKQEPGRTGLMLGCLAYLMQAAVNIAQPFTTPLFFLLLFLPDGEKEEKRDDWASRVLAVLLALSLLLVSAASSHRAEERYQQQLFGEVRK